MLSNNELSVALNTIPTQALNKIVFRSVSLHDLLSVAPLHILYDLGPRTNGQRYSPIDPNGPRALYVSGRSETSFWEASGGLFSTITSVNQNWATPMVLIPIRVNLKKVLDLTEPSIQSKLDTTLAELTGSWEMQMLNNISVSTQELGCAAFNCQRFQGIRFPSVPLSGHINLLIWTETIVAPLFVEVIDYQGRFAERIPD